MRFVIDASIVVKWLTPEAGSDRALAMRNDELLAPDLVLIEVGNALWKYRRRDVLSADAFEAAIDVVQNAPIKTTRTAELMPAAARLAVELDHPIYDCFYLALAMREGCPLITDDQRLLKVAGARFGGFVRAL